MNPRHKFALVFTAAMVLPFLANVAEPFFVGYFGMQFLLPPKPFDLREH